MSSVAKVQSEEGKNDLSAEQKPNLMTFIPKAEDDYLETLRNCGVTVKCVPKRNTIKPVQTDVDVKAEENVSEEINSLKTSSFNDISHLLNNSSISIVSKSKPTPKPTLNDDEVDPIAKLTSLGCGISIERKKSNDSAKNSADEQVLLKGDNLLENETILTDTSKKLEKVSIPSKDELAPRENFVEQTFVDKNTVEKIVNEQDYIEETLQIKSIVSEIQNNECDIKVKRKGKQSRCSSRNSIQSNDSSVDNTSDSNKEQIQRKRGGRRGRKRGSARSVSRGRKSYKRTHYESDEDYKSQARSNPDTKRQTRGKKISLSHYSESEESDYEHYLYETSLSPHNDLIQLHLGQEKSILEQNNHVEINDSTENQSELKLKLQGIESSNDDNKVEELVKETEEKTTTSNSILSKISISILKNEDYSEVLRSQTESQSNEQSLNDSGETPSESADSINFDSRSVTPSASIGYLSDSSKTDEIPNKKRRAISSVSSEHYPSDDLFCWYCKRNFSKTTLFWKHISSHVRLPHVYLTRVTPEEIEHHCGVGYKYIPSNKPSSLKLTLKTNNNHEFEIINKDNMNSLNESSEFSVDVENEKTVTSEDRMEMDENSVNNDDNMELDDPIEDNSSELEHNENYNEEDDNIIEQNSYNGERETENETYNENSQGSEEITSDTSNTEDSTNKSAQAQQTYIPGVRIRSLESVQRLDSSTPETQNSSSNTSSTQNSPTLRVRTNLTSPQSTNMSHIQNQLASNNSYPQQQQHHFHHLQQQQSQHQQQQPPPHYPNQHQNSYNNPYQTPMGPPPPSNMYSQQMTYNNNGGYSSYSSYNQTTYVANGNYSPSSSYWSNSNSSIPGPTSDNVDPLALPPEEDPLKIPTSGEKEQEAHGNLLKSFLDGNNTTSVNHNIVGDNSSMAEFMPLDRLSNASTCPVCSERFPDVPSLEEHKRRLNHYGSAQSGSSTLQPIGSQALQTLAGAHNNMQPIQHQIRVQHNVIVNNVIQQPPPSMAPLPPYGQPQIVDNSMQQLTQQVNRMPPPPSNQYGPYGPSQSYGGQQHYRMPALPAPAPPGSTSQQYNQNNYGPQYGQYPNNQQMTLPPPPSSATNQHQPNTAQQQYPPPQRSAIPGQIRPSRPSGMPPNVRPRGQAYLPTTQSSLPPPPSGSMRPPGIRGSSYRPPMNRTPQMTGPRMQGPPRAMSSMNTATRMRRPMPASVQQQQNEAQKRKRMDVLIPDRHEDPDCHVIAVQQRNDDLPVIQNVQGNVQEQDPLSKAKDSMIHLTDSITLSVRGKEQNGNNSNSSNQLSQQKPSPASAVADILATRGITVTPAAKSNNQSKSNDTSDNSVAQIAINLNNSVSIIPAQKNNVDRPARPPSTVDLTDDPSNAQQQDSLSTSSSLVRPNKPYKCSICPKQFNSQDLYTQHVTKHRTLPFRCDHCSAAYPKQIDLMNHKKNCRALNSSSASDLGLPVIDLRKSHILQNLSRLGIHHYIPLAQGNNNGIFGLPIVSVEGARNPNIVNLSALGTNQLLPLGPVRQIPMQNRTQQ